MTHTNDFLVSPNPSDPRLTERVVGIAHDGSRIETSVTVERPLTLYLNGREIVTMMTIGDYPEYLALGFLKNQRMLLSDDKVKGIDFDLELNTIVVRTENKTNFEDKLKKKTQTSGCAVGTGVWRRDGKVC